jgi:hypothetical protein
MIERSEITEQLNIILRQKFQRHICSILYDDEKYLGTGNLIKHNNQLFILTCHHVAIEACTFRNLEIIFPGNEILKRNQITLFRKHKFDDIALLRIEEPNFELGELVPLTLSEFTRSADLRSFSESNSQFVVGGFPGSLAKQNTPNSATFILKALLFQTMPPIGKRQTKAKIYLEYKPENTNNRKLPDAPGISGGGIWYVPPINLNNQVLSPTHWKIIGIQSAWKRGEYIVGTRVQKIFEWLA